MSEIKNTLTVTVPIAAYLLEGDTAIAKKLNEEFKKNGIKEGTPVSVEVLPRKYFYRATATWN